MIIARLQHMFNIQKLIASYIPAMNKWNLKLKVQYHLH